MITSDDPLSSARALVMSVTLGSGRYPSGVAILRFIAARRIRSREARRVGSFPWDLPPWQATGRGEAPERSKPQQEARGRRTIDLTPSCARPLGSNHEHTRARERYIRPHSPQSLARWGNARRPWHGVSFSSIQHLSPSLAHPSIRSCSTLFPSPTHDRVSFSSFPKRSCEIGVGHRDSVVGTPLAPINREN